VSLEHVDAGSDIALVDLLDRLLDGGVVITGDIMLSVADVDLVYVGLRLVLTSAKTVRQPPQESPNAQPRPDSAP
jgi:hypothetical protein